MRFSIVCVHHIRQFKKFKLLSLKLVGARIPEQPNDAQRAPTNLCYYITYMAKAAKNTSKIVSQWLGNASSKNTKAASKTSVSNEQQLEGPGGQGGESRGGFDPLMGWSAAAGVGLAGIVYAKTKASGTNIPVPKVRGKETWTAEEQSNYYAGQAAVMEKEARKMSHPSYFSSVPLNKRNQEFNEIARIKLMNDADRLRKRANHIATGIPKKK